MTRSWLRWAPLALLALSPAAGLADARVGFLHTPPRSCRAGLDLEISGNVSGAGDVDRAYVHYRNEGEQNYRHVELAPEQGDLYHAVIPGARIRGPALEYFVEVVDFFGQSHEVLGSPERPQRVSVSGGDASPPPPRREELPPPPPRREVPPPPKREPPPVAKTSDLPPPKGKPPPKVAERDEPPRDGTREVTHEGPRESKGALAEELALFGAEDPVSVASGHEQKVSEAPAVVSVVSGDHIQKMGARTLADVLKTLPGFETSRDVQGYHHVAIRGLHNDSEVLLLYDGHRLNNPYDAKALWELPAQAIERVEVIRGPASALYGAGAFMGVVNVLPRRHEGVAVTAGGGWFSGAPANADAPWDGEAHLAAGAKVADLVSLHLDGDVVRSAGSSRAVASDGITATLRSTNGPDGTPLLAKDKPAGYTNDKQLLFNVGAAVRFDLKEGTDAGIDLRLLRQQRGALIGLFDTLGTAGQLTWQTLLVGAHADVKLGENTVGARFHFDTQSVDNLFQLAPRGYPSSGGNFFTDGVFEEFQYGTRSLGGEVSFERPLFEGNRLSVGLQASQDALTSYDDLSNVGFDSNGKLIDLHANQPPNFSGCKPNPPDTACQLPQKSLGPRLTLGALVQDEWRVGSIGITAGVRYDRYTQSLADARQPIQASTAPPLTTNTGDAFSPRLGLVWAAAEGLTVKGLFASAYRAPTFQELSDYVVPVGSFATGRFAGVPDLRPVHIYSGELAAEYLFKTDPARIRLRGNGFYERVTDPIVAVDTTGNSNQPYQNRGEQGVQVFGTEVEGRAEFGPRHYVYLNLTWFRAQDDAAPAGFNLLTDVPQYKMHWGLVLGLGSFLDFSAQSTLAAERRNDSRTVLESLRFWRIPAYALVDAALQTQPLAVGPGTVGVAIVVRNLFDYDYRDTPYRPDRIPGLIPLASRSGFLELRAKF